MRTIDKARTILNTAFIVLAVVTLILYLIDNEGREFFYAGITAMSVKVLEFILRFVN
jgi:hypothetical protein